MSHAATNWAIKQRGLTPTQKIVLWHLADRHNPDFGCFPSQKQLAYDCEIGRSTLNRHMIILEEMGLIAREKRVNKTTKRQKSTRYILGFEKEFEQHIESRVPNRDMEAVSQNEQKPCPISDESRVPNRDTNPVREPVREPLLLKNNEDQFYSDFLASHPKPRHSRPEFDQAIADGVCPKLLVESAQVYANETTSFDRDKIAFSDNFIKRKIYLKYLPPVSGAKTSKPFTPNPVTIAMVKRGDAAGVKYISTDIAKKYIACGEITPDEFQKVGVII